MVLTPEELLTAFTGFSVSHWRSSRVAGLVPEPHGWILDHPDSWHVARFPDPPNGAQKVILFLGEAGTGKTTQLNYQASSLALHDENLVVLIDFSQVYLTNSPLEVFQRRVWQHVAGQITPIIERRGLVVPYRAAQYRYFMETYYTPSLTALRDKYGYNGPYDFSTMNDEELAGCDEILEAIGSHEETSNGSLALRAVQHIPDHRTIICIDNVDHLGIEKVEIVMAMLTAVIERDTLAYVAVRPEHEHLVRAFRQSRHVLPFRFQIDESLVFRIAEKRCAGAVDYAYEHKIHVDPVRTYASRLLDLSAAIREDPHSVTVLNSWHNGDLRQMLEFLTRASWSTFNRESQASVRSLIYRTLVQASMPESLMKVFETTSYPCKLYSEPFIFPSLRVLAYLKHHNAGNSRAIDVSRIVQDFDAQFGLSSAMVESAIEDLANEPAQSGALLRVTDDGRRRYVVFLPAGEVFMSHIIFSCDFLSWVYDRSTNDTLPSVESPTNYRQAKLDKAAHVLKYKLLPLFEKEHPYMKQIHGRLGTPSHARRLRAYESLFGYRPGNWFIQQLVGALTDYATTRRLEMTALNKARISVNAATGRLDATYNHPSMR